jgi:hypothetical protein
MSAAPGAPGLPPTWCSSAKEMVGCSLGHARLWFTIGGGIINEVYYPRVDLPQIRDLGFIVADGAGFWIEVKRLWKHELRLAAPGVPAVHIVHHHERFDLTLREPGAVRWGLDGWQEVREQDTAANPLGLHVLQIDTSQLRAGRCIDLTFRSGANWVGTDFRISVTTRSRQPG